MQATLIGKSNRLTKMPELYASHVVTYDTVAAANSLNEMSDEDTDSPEYVAICTWVDNSIM